MADSAAAELPCIAIFPFGKAARYLHHDGVSRKHDSVHREVLRRNSNGVIATMAKMPGRRRWLDVT
jgi:hypothetical protein